MGGAGALDFWLRGKRGLGAHTSESEGGGARGWRTVFLGVREKGAGIRALREQGAQAGLLSLREGAGRLSSWV